MKLALIYTGGTIGCTGKPLKPLAAKEFQALWQRHVRPQLDRDIKPEWHWLEPALDSSEMMPVDWIRLARLVLTDDRQATLLLHGTDTMAWTAAALAFLLTLYRDDGSVTARFPHPVILTGAQRPLFGPDGLVAETDAIENLRLSIQACRSKFTGVKVAFGSSILPGARVMKMSTSADWAFACPNGSAIDPILPAADNIAVLAQLDRLAPHFGNEAIVNISPLPADGSVISGQVEALIEWFGEGLGAIHMSGFGIGNFPGRETVAPLLRSAHDRGTLIIAGSQVPFGDADPWTYGAGHWLKDCGAISTADMATPAVHAKAYLAMALRAANGWGQTETEQFFQTPVAGELRS